MSSVASPAKREILVPAREARAFVVKAGQYLQVTDLQGMQVGDFAAFSEHDSTEWLSTARTRRTNASIYLRKGHHLYTNKLRPMLKLVEDTVGVHDILRPQCSPELNALEGHPGVQNCMDNLAAVLAPYGIDRWRIPETFNIFEDAPVLPDGTMVLQDSPSRPGDYVILRAEMDVLCALSACPYDYLPCNGGTITDLLVTILDALPAG
ncbi:MAG: urea carboxylase-associated family protein [Chloroflexi bacterium]|nr:urea carboxylase-associated family protein [Chloroflexota bacterium]